MRPLARMRRVPSVVSKTLSLSVLVLALVLAPARAQGDDVVTPERADELFSQIDSMLESVEDIMGIEAAKPIARSLISRDEINELVAERLSDEAAAEDIAREELFLRLFGFVGDDFDLAAEVVDVLTEQATALYDYKTKQLYLSTWTPPDMQEYALVHELAHAVADQHYDLGKYLSKSRSADADLARSAVIEGQASWVMTEWVFRQTGRSLLDDTALAAAAAGASRFEVANYPVFSAQPLYLQESMLFPYTEGMIFQQNVLLEHGRDGFRELFENPPLSTQHIFDPTAYLRRREPLKPRLPRLPRLKRFERVSKGDIGHLDHWVLLKQHINLRVADRVAPAWRGARYEIWQNQTESESVLRYASVWAGPADAKRFFERYLDVSQEGLTAGRFEGGGFELRLEGSTVTSVEGAGVEMLASISGTTSEAAGDGF